MLDRKRLLAALAIAITCMLWLRPVTWMFDRGDPDFRDFAPVIAGAHCLFSSCDPYDGSFDENYFHQLTGRGVFMAPDTPVYPPSTFAVVSPLLPFSWRPMHLTWTMLSAGMLLACLSFLIMRFTLYTSVVAFLPILFALQSGLIFPLLWLGQPATIAMAAGLMGLVLLVCGCTVPFAAALLALSLCLKPQLAFLPAVYLLLHRPARKGVVIALAISAAVLLLSTALLRAHLGSLAFLGHESANMKLSLEPGRLSDPSPANEASADFLNLQAPLSRFLPNAHLDNAIAFAVTALLGLALVGVYVRFPAARARPYSMMAMLAVLSLLPVYHRTFDRMIMLMLIPAIWEMRRMRPVYYCLTTIAAGLWIFDRRIAHHLSGAYAEFPTSALVEVAICALLLASLIPIAERVRTATPPVEARATPS